MFNFNNIYNTDVFKRFYCPTKILAGKGISKIVFDLIRNDYNVVLVLDLYFNNNELVKKIKSIIPIEKLKLFLVSEEPTKEIIDNFIGEIGDFKMDCLIAIGGGSTIDSAKALLAFDIYSTYYKVGYGELRDLEEVSFQNKPKFIAIPTTAGTGSETSRYYLITDSNTKEKTVSRSWSVVPEVTILDPIFLVDAPKELLILTAFDTFVHLWETFICKYERSQFGDMLSVTGISKIITVINKLMLTDELDADDIIELQIASSLGGIAIANVRTGLMHDAGEALSAQVKLSHPETLIVFFKEALLLIEGETQDRQEILFQNATIATLDIKSISDLIIFWDKLFVKYGIIKSLWLKNENVTIEPKIILEKIMMDKVLVDKESPIKLDPIIVLNFITKSIQKKNDL